MRKKEASLPSYVHNDVRQPVTIRWTCEECGHVNTRTETLYARGQVRKDFFRTYDECRQDALIDAALKMGAMVNDLRARQDKWKKYRPMHLNCACEHCDRREPWASNGPAFDLEHPVLTLLLYIPAMIAAMVTVIPALFSGLYILFFGPGYAPPWLLWSIGAIWVISLASLAGYILYRIRRNRKLRELSDSAFPILAEETPDPAGPDGEAQDARSSGAVRTFPKNLGDAGSGARQDD